MDEIYLVNYGSNHDRLYPCIIAAFERQEDAYQFIQDNYPKNIPSEFYVTIAPFYQASIQVSSIVPELGIDYD